VAAPRPSIQIRLGDPFGMSDHKRVDEVRERFARSAFHTSFLGARLGRVEPGGVEVELEVGPDHVNLFGTLHGGLIATLADTATGLSMLTSLEPGMTHMTTSLSVTFLAPGRAGVVTARARVMKRGRRFGYAEADVVSDAGELLARASATFVVMPERDASAAPSTKRQ
jgi:uncharacterized protein (TIGR00369 family)